MYLGRYESKLAAKNRVVVPAKFREISHDQLLITNWLEKSIAIVKESDFETWTAEWKDASILLPETRDFMRFVYGGAEKITLDALGRFVVPNHLLTHAEIEKDIMFVGAGSHIELWSRNNWEAYYTLTSIQTRATAVRLFERNQQR